MVPRPSHQPLPADSNPGSSKARLSTPSVVTTTPGVVASALRAFLYGALETSEESPLDNYYYTGGQFYAPSMTSLTTPSIFPPSPSPSSFSSSSSSPSSKAGGGGGAWEHPSSKSPPNSRVVLLGGVAGGGVGSGGGSSSSRGVAPPPLSPPTHIPPQILAQQWSPLTPRGVRRLPPLHLAGEGYHLDSLLDAPSGRVLRTLAGALRAHAKVEGWALPNDLLTWCANHPWGTHGMDSSVWALPVIKRQPPPPPPPQGQVYASGTEWGEGTTFAPRSSEGGNTKKNTLLGGVLDLLRLVGEELYTETVVAVGRTAEEDRLRALFPIAGHPVDLFRGCLAQARRCSTTNGCSGGGGVGGSSTPDVFSTLPPTPLHTQKSVRALRTAAALLLLVQDHIMREEDYTINKQHALQPAPSSSSSPTHAGAKNSPRVLKDTLEYAGNLLATIGVPLQAVRVLTGPTTASEAEVEGALSAALSAAIASAPSSSPHLALLLASMVTSTATYCARLQFSSPHQGDPPHTLSSGGGAPVAPVAPPVKAVGVPTRETAGGGFWGALIGILVGDTTSEDVEGVGGGASVKLATAPVATGIVRVGRGKALPTLSNNPILLALAEACVPLPILNPSQCSETKVEGKAILSQQPQTGSGVTGEVAAVSRLAREVVELQSAYLARKGKREVAQKYLRIPCIVLLAHLLQRG